LFSRQIEAILNDLLNSSYDTALQTRENELVTTIHCLQSAQAFYISKL